MKLKLSKYIFSETKVTYLGHIISAERIRPDDTKLDTERNMKEPTKTKNIKSIRGLVYHITVNLFLIVQNWRNNSQNFLKSISSSFGPKNNKNVLIS